jgi:predicted PurR-regulated permease PerM
MTKIYPHDYAKSHFLVDLLVVFFLGIVLAAALQPGHVRLHQFGIPKGLAVFLIYLLFIVGMGFIVLFIGPVLIEQIRTFAVNVPEQYANLVEWLRTNPTPLLQRLGQRIPPFAVLVQNIANLAPSFFANAVGALTSTVSFFSYLVVVLAVGFYWTMEVPRVERLILSLVTVARRPHVLNTWHEIEFKLGAYIRGQGLAMVIIGAASAVGYFLIGLPNVLALAVLAGLFEAVPLIGPILAAVPAIVVALPLGLTPVLLVIGFSVLLQAFENNVLIPRIMSRAVGISALVSMFAVLALGNVYGIVGVFVAIPLTVIVQVIVEQMVINPIPVPEEATVGTNPLATLRTRVQTLRQQMRQRLRERDSRMGIDPQTPEHVADAVDQRIEQAVERVATAITTAQEDTEAGHPEAEKAVVAELQQATKEIERAVEHVETDSPAPQPGMPTGTSLAEEHSVLNDLPQVTQRAEEAVQRLADEQTEQRSAAATNKTHMPSPSLLTTTSTRTPIPMLHSEETITK